MPDKIVNHFVLADGSTAKYDAGSLLNLDETVSLAGYAPDAKAVGDRLTAVETKNTEQDGRLDSLEADGSVTTNKLANDAVTSDKIANGSLLTVDYSDQSVTRAKLSMDVQNLLAYIPQLWRAITNGYSNTAPVVTQGTLTFSQGDAEFTHIN